MTNRTTESLLARRALAEKATKGDWYMFRLTHPSDHFNVRASFSAANVEQICRCNAPTDANQANAAHIAANDPSTVIADIDEILRLRAEVEFWRQETQDVRENFERTLQCERDKTDRLEREADWLAEQLSDSCSFTGEHNCGIPKPCPKTYGCGCLDVEAEEWREAARKAMEEVK